MQKNLFKKANRSINLFAQICKKTSLIAVAMLILSGIPTFKPSPVKAQKVPDQFTQQTFIESKQFDKRAQILHNYLASRNSPLQNYAQDFVDAADYYNIDWRLLPAISGVESTFGQFEPSGSHNGWGWGGSNLIYFNSWKEAIYTIDEGLSERYHVTGKADPFVLNRTYASSPTWGARVSYFLNDIDQFANGNEVQPNQYIQDTSFLDSIQNDGLLTKKVSTCYNFICVSNDPLSQSGQSDILSDATN